MANLSELNTVITDLFTVIGTIITNMVDLMTGDLLVLAIVGGFVSLILGIIFALLYFIKGHFKKSVSGTKMK